MLFKSIKLNNFGIYRGEHHVDLECADPEKPIVLLGGLNGGGKTTFLDSLQLALYGRFAKCSNRGRLSYSDYLKQAINRSADKQEAHIHLVFSHKATGRKESIYEIQRKWSVLSSGTSKEELTVLVDGEHDAFLSEHWDEFVSEFIPQNLSELFFFDGEKIELLADPKRSSVLVKTGLESLLGLDLLSKLSNDLAILKRERGKEGLNEVDTAKITAIETEISVVEQELNLLTKAEDEIEQSLVALRQRHDEDTHALTATGADKLQEKDTLIREIDRTKAKIDAQNAVLMKAAAGVMPLMAAKSLFDRTRDKVFEQQENENLASAQHYLDSLMRDAAALFAELGGQACQQANFEAQLQRVREMKYQTQASGYVLSAKPLQFEMAAEAFAREMEEVENHLKTKQSLLELHTLLKQKLETIPMADTVAHQLEALAKLEAQIEQLELKLTERHENHERLEARRQSLNAELNKLLVNQTNANFERQRSEYVVDHIGEMSEIIAEFKQQQVEKNIDRLEKRIYAKFARLERKAELISAVKICAKSFQVTLYDHNGGALPTSRLSAGERQLLAVAILWALAELSGKDIPTIIDTPMGRLDGKHRTKLIEKYFPFAASQVILLSTDEEISGQYYKKLKPSISQEYHIEYREDLRTSTITEGYFKAAV